MRLFIKKVGSGTTRLIISNEEMNDIMKITKSLVESGLWINGIHGMAISESIKTKQNNKKGNFLECY